MITGLQNRRLQMKKGAKRPMPKSDGECSNGGNHMYQMYGAPYECCVKCGKKHDTIIEWVQNIADGKPHGGHPFVETGIWSTMEYKKYMRMK